MIRQIVATRQWIMSTIRRIIDTRCGIIFMIYWVIATRRWTIPMICRVIAKPRWIISIICGVIVTRCWIMSMICGIDKEHLYDVLSLKSFRLRFWNRHVSQEKCIEQLLRGPQQLAVTILLGKPFT